MIARLHVNSACRVYGALARRCSSPWAKLSMPAAPVAHAHSATHAPLEAGANEDTHAHTSSHTDTHMRAHTQAHAHAQTSAAQKPVKVEPGDAAALERIVLARRSVGRFDPSKPVSEDDLRWALALTLRSPSGFNLQPYRIIVVRDPHRRRELASACLGGNGKRVSDAPVTVVFAADLQPMRRMDELVDIERHAGKPVTYLRNLPFDASVYAGSGAAQPLTSTVLSAVSLVAPMPTVHSIETWSIKHTMVAAQSYLLAATAAGLGTHAMEGVDVSRVRSALRLPSRWTVPVIVATGHPWVTETGEIDRVPSPRFRSDSMVHADVYGNPMKGI